MRDLADIDRDILAASERLRALRNERQHYLWVWRNRIVAAFDDGMSMIDLVSKTGLSYDSVRAILYRAGRTVKRRGVLRKLIHNELRTPA